MYYFMKKNLLKILFLMFLIYLAIFHFYNSASHSKQYIICDDPIIESTYRKDIGDIKWKPLTSEIKLNPYNAILTCKNSYIILVTNYPFNCNTIRWKEEDLHFVGKLGESILLILKDIKTFSDYSLSLNVSVREISGEVYYSDERDIIKKIKTSSIKFHDEYNTDELIEKNRAAKKELSDFLWTPAEIGMILGEWNIIWVKKNSTVEMEVTIGHVSKVIVPTDVKINGDTISISGEIYWIMAPEHILPLKIKEIEGEAYVLRDKGKVSKFYQKYEINSFSTTKSAQNQGKP